MEKEVITIKGHRNTWYQFIARVKTNRKQVWEVLEPFLKSYKGTVSVKKAKASFEKEIITIKGHRNTWYQFIAKVKTNRKQVWEVLEPFLKDYTKGKVEYNKK